MNRNADLVLRVLAFPIVMAITQLRVLGLVGGTAFLLLAHTDVEPVRIIIYGFVAVAAIMLATALSHFGGGLLGGVVIVVAVIVMWKSEVIFDRVIPTSDRIHLTENIPVSIRHSVSGDAIVVSIINNSSDWLEATGVVCQGYFADGSPMERPWTKTVSWGHWLAPGEEIERAQIASVYPDDPSRYDLDRTTCRVVHADFRRMPAFIPSIEFEPQSGSGHSLFHVTNDNSVTICRLWFSCIGSNRFRESISTRPAYSEELDYQIEPGGTLTLMTSDARYGLTSCRVYAVKML
ncbi:hypothetical protein VQ042_23995 [Aurantimonas sp. A2-1-M11]|uniref:hypothetical protein n=1 Tax=Aurantimonas sp. A2-1-M11 TaxID=3113712 RepID=UPI002F93CA04